jgi:molybdopterin converting factor small subunit
MGKVLFATKDKLQNNVEIFINDATAYPNELVKPVKEGDEIHLVVMLAGG